MWMIVAEFQFTWRGLIVTLALRPLAIKFHMSPYPHTSRITMQVKIFISGSPKSVRFQHPITRKNVSGLTRERRLVGVSSCPVEASVSNRRDCGHKGQDYQATPDKLPMTNCSLSRSQWRIYSMDALLTSRTGNRHFLLASLASR